MYERRGIYNRGLPSDRLCENQVSSSGHVWCTTCGVYFTESDAKAGSPLHRENWENAKKNPCQGKRMEFGNFAI